ncbi:MAG: DUF1553 domain-containing protein, partial [Verrucomicrobium sp.]
PYDEFTRDQIAGDLLPQATQEQLIATAFHRNTMTNTEGGTDDEEFRVAAVKDRIKTTMQVWMGLTLGCAQCHTHKFDPITQQEYYEFFAIFNQTEDSDRGDEAPTLPVPDAAQSAQLASLKKEIDALEKQLNSPATEPFLNELAAWETSMKQPSSWETLAFSSVKSEKGVGVRQEADKDQAVFSEVVESDTHTLDAVVNGGITAIKVEALNDDRLPGKGPGGSGGGNFVLSEVKATTTPEADGGLPKVRFVRVSLPGKARLLHLAEVQVFAQGKNVAPAGTASQSSTGFNGPAQLATDGNTNGDYGKGSVTHCAQQDDPWWEVDLKQEVPVDAIMVWNRTDGGTGKRTADFTVTALDSSRKEVFQRRESNAPQPSTKLALSGTVELRFKEATADFEQADYAAAHAIDGKENTGWAIAPATGKPHTAVFLLDKPAGRAGERTRLQLSLAQLYGANHILGRYRVSITRDAHPQSVLPEKVQQVLAIAAAERSAEQQATLLEWYKPKSRAFATTRRELDAKKAALAAIKPVTLPVMKELAGAKQRISHFLVKGNFLNPADEVKPSLLKSFNPAPPAPDRRAVADWLMSRDNPLTARVTVNRFWAQLFGTGLVETEEDFGTQGTLPTHPELLDWLAIEFMDLKWDVKALLKTLVTSETYRQSSKASPEALAKDQRNLLVSHYPRRRLDAEQVRDQALVLSGLFSPKLGGPSVFPPQPDGLWRAAFNGQRSWETSKGEDRYRRGMYTFWRRTVPYPSMATFDAPSRENSTMRRLPTNTPLQAFVTLNDPAFFEMAQALGRRVVKEGGATLESRLRYGLELSLARPATEDQVNALLELYRDELAHFQSQPDAAAKLAGEHLPDTTAAEAAAWTMVANVLLNLDGVLMKG